MIYQTDENGKSIDDTAEQFPGGGVQRLPDEDVIFYTGVSSAVLIIIFAPVAVVLGAYVYQRAKKALAAYDAEPVAYTQNSLNRVRTGRACAIIAMAIPAMVLAFFAVLLVMSVLSHSPHR